MLLDKKYLVPANGEANHGIAGQYVRLLGSTDSTQKIRLRTDNDDDVLLSVGRGIRFDREFRQLYFSHDNTNDVTIDVTIGDGESEDVDFAQTNDVNVSNPIALLQGTTFETEHRALTKDTFMAAKSAPSLGNTWMHDYLINPVGSGKLLVVDKISLHSSGSISAFKFDTLPSAYTDISSTIGKKNTSLNDSVAIIGRENTNSYSAPASAGSVYVDSRSSSTVESALKSDAIILAEGEGLAMVFSNVGSGANDYAGYALEWEEIAAAP